MVLLAIDEAMRSSKQERIVIEGPLTVEHVFPQEFSSEDWRESSESEHYISNPEETAEEWRWRLIHSMGNLTLLTQQLNSSVSNGRYNVKRPEIACQSALRINTYFQNQLEWDERAIIERGEKLFEYAMKIWPFPNTSEPEQ